MTSDLAGFHRLAVVSVVAGALAFGSLFVEPMLAMMLSLPALTSGVWARREISTSGRPVRGLELAGLGIALGTATLVLWVGLRVLAPW